MRSPLSSLFLILSFVLLFGALIFLYSLWPKEPVLKSQSPSNSREAARKTEESTAYTGRVLGEENLLGLFVRRLVDEEGKTVVYLQSGKIDLRILQPNLKIVVEGRIAKILEGNRPLVLVDKLNFR